MKKFLLFLILSPVVFAQSIPEPVYNTGIYSFLENLSFKGIINLNENIKPFTRDFIARKLTEIDESGITSLEKEYLEFYKKEFYYEIKRIPGVSDPGTSGYQQPIPDTSAHSKLEIIKSGESGRWRLFKYNDENFYAYLDPILGIDWRYNGDTYVRHRWNGAKAGGYIGSSWGFYLDFRDNEEYGAGRDSLKEFTRETGINIIKETSSSFEWSEVRGGITYSWDNGSISFEKEFLNWGSGRGGQLIYSTKPPSFPYIKLQINPVDWLNFIYIHGFLNSEVIDSSSVRSTLVDHRDSYYDIPKYIAAHMISFNITGSLNFSLGESVVYSDKVEPLYLIPVMFFRLADHYLSKRYADSGDNAQLFADASYKNDFLRTKFYGTFFIDEMSVTSMLEGVKLNAIAYTIGATTADPVFNNSNLTIEYSRLNPFVYMNSNDAQLYTNNDYQLGHWIGSNADQIYVSYTQKILRGLELSTSIEWIRRGQEEDAEDQYKLPYPEFLYGERRDVTGAEVRLSYEFVHDLFLKAYYHKLEDENIGLSLYYGL